MTNNVILKLVSTQKIYHIHSTTALNPTFCSTGCLCEPNDCIVKKNEKNLSISPKLGFFSKLAHANFEIKS